MDVDNLDNLDVQLPKEFDGLPVFAVGGVVRDTIRGELASDTDLMVAEVAPDEMRERGFTEVDNDNDTFGVFVDSLNREVALPREEKSTGNGHKDFDVDTVEASVKAGEAVQRDLKRRDIAINSMAFDLRHDVLHDPFNGVQDLRDGVIRATSGDSFKEDPLRVIRAARFASRLNFEIEAATKSMMTDSVEALDSLPTERLRMELTKALVESPKPSRFFEVLDEIGALKTTFPELHALKEVPAGPPEHHSEGDSLTHTMMVLDEMKEIRPNDEIGLLMALSHDLGKGVTDEEDLPSHPTHAINGVAVAEAMAERLSMSNEQETAMREAARLHMQIHNFEELRESTVLDIVDHSDNLDRLLDLAVADSRGRIPQSEFDKDGADARFSAAIQAQLEWPGSRLIANGFDPDEIGGKEFGDLLNQRRVEKMREIEGLKSNDDEE